MLLSEGARKLLQRAIENEVVEYLETNRERRTEAGQRAIVRNGYHPERELVTGILTTWISLFSIGRRKRSLANQVFTDIFSGGDAAVMKTKRLIHSGLVKLKR